MSNGEGVAFLCEQPHSATLRLHVSGRRKAEMMGVCAIAGHLMTSAGVSGLVAGGTEMTRVTFESGEKRIADKITRHREFLRHAGLDSAGRGEGVGLPEFLRLLQGQRAQVATHGGNGVYEK